MSAADLLDRLVWTDPLSVPAGPAPSARPPGGHVQQAGPDTPVPLATPARAGLTTGCVCSHSATWHDRFGPCAHPGCTCSRFTKNRTPRPLVPGRGA